MVRMQVDRLVALSVVRLVISFRHFRPYRFQPALQTQFRLRSSTTYYMLLITYYLLLVLVAVVVVLEVVVLEVVVAVLIHSGVRCAEYLLD